MKLNIKKASTSKLIEVFISDSSSTTGAGLTGLTFNSASLTAYYFKNGGATATAITLITMTIGTWASSGFVEMDSVNLPGWYQIGIPNAALTTADSVALHLKGATNMAPLPIEIQLLDNTNKDIYDIINNGTYGNAQLVRATTPANTLDISVTGEAGMDWANIGSPAAVIDLAGTNINLVDTVTTYTGNTKQTADVAARVPNVLNTTALGNIGMDWANIENPASVVDLAGTDINLVDTTTVNTDMRGTDNGALAAIATEARLAELDAANLPLNIDNILIDTGTTLDAKINAIQGATFDTATDSLESIRNRGDAAWTTGAGGSDRLLMVDTTIATLASQTSFTLNAGSADDNAYNNCTIVIEDVTTATQKAVGVISNYVGATKTVTLKYDPAIFTMAATDKIYILAENALKSALANRQLDVTATGAVKINWGNIENKSAVVDLSGTDFQLCDTVSVLTGHTVQTGDTFAQLPTNFSSLSISGAGLVDILQTAADKVWGTTARLLTAGTNIVLAKGVGLTGLNDISAAQVNAEADTALADYGANTITPPTSVAIRTEIDNNSTRLLSIFGDTNELQSDWVNGGRLDLLLDAIKAKTDNQPEGIQKNVTFNNFYFTMIDSTDNISPKTGLTITAQRVMDGGAYTSMANSAAEVGNGTYVINLATADTNGDSIRYRFSATGALATEFTFKTVT